MTSSDNEINYWRKKPVEVIAVQLDTSNLLSVANWCNGNAKTSGDIEIKTLEGTMRANPGDFIIKGVMGEFYPCKPDIFKQTYEKVE